MSSEQLLHAPVDATTQFRPKHQLEPDQDPKGFDAAIAKFGLRKQNSASGKSFRLVQHTKNSGDLPPTMVRELTGIKCDVINDKLSDGRDAEVDEIEYDDVPVDNLSAPLRRASSAQVVSVEDASSAELFTMVPFEGYNDPDLAPPPLAREPSRNESGFLRKKLEKSFNARVDCEIRACELPRFSFSAAFASRILEEDPTLPMEAFEPRAESPIETPASPSINRFEQARLNFHNQGSSRSLPGSSRSLVGTVSVGLTDTSVESTETPASPSINRFEQARQNFRNQGSSRSLQGSSRSLIGTVSVGLTDTSVELVEGSLSAKSTPRASMNLEERSKLSQPRPNTNARFSKPSDVS